MIVLMVLLYNNLQPLNPPSTAGDRIKALEGDLAGYYRLRIRSYRVIFAYRGTKRPGPPEIDCLFCEHRSVVYEAFAAMAAGDPGSLSRHGG